MFTKNARAAQRRFEAAGPRSAADRGAIPRWRRGLPRFVGFAQGGHVDLCVRLEMQAAPLIHGDRDPLALSDAYDLARSGCA